MTIIDQYAVFGQPIKHSQSPKIHQLFAEQTQQVLTYTAQEVAPEQFKTACDAFFAENGKGLNCTVPLKELAFHYADQLTERAQRAKAVNTLAKQSNGTILGDNTDGIGLVNDLMANHGINLKAKRLLILGAGGATRGILAPLLAEQPTDLVIANRTLSKAEQLVSEFADLGHISSSDFAGLADSQFDVILNATSASLSDELPPLPEHLLAKSGSCYDLAYGNQPTAFVRWGITNQAVHSLDGLGMLVEQASAAFFLWRGVKPETAGVLALLNSQRG